MITLARFANNPIVVPDTREAWQKEAVFNGSVVFDGKQYHMLYRAQSSTQDVKGQKIELSTIGHATSADRVTFSGSKQLITPEYEWEAFGCEDPRVTRIDDVYYIFYTALSHFPPDASAIKVAVAVSKDLTSIQEKHLVTPFNAKAMALFPRKINGKFVVLLTAHTDMPPAKICIAQFEKLEDMWDPKFWEAWYADLDLHSLPLLRSSHDHIEVGAVPVETKIGWLVLYCYIRNYQTGNKLFGIEALLLDPDDPFRVIGKTQEPLLTPETEYERYGKIPNVIFPSSALIYNNDLGLYYGAADTSICLATVNLDRLIDTITPHPHSHTFGRVSTAKRYAGNPIIAPILEHTWEDRYTFNPAALLLNKRVHILYRAMGRHNTSVLGYASSPDGIHVDERLKSPAYMPREEFERKLHPGYSGCEDPRITQIGDTIYMCYTAYDSINPTRVALTSIKTNDFIAHEWNWARPTLISPPGMNDKNACLFPEKVKGKHVFFHRLHHCIWIDFVDDLTFGEGKWLGGEAILKPTVNTWYSEKIGIGPPPVKTDAGWLLICHGLSKQDNRYRLGAILLNSENPAIVEAMLEDPILSPHAEYENNGLRPGTVFACGAVILRNDLMIYYGASDETVCVASVELDSLIDNLVAVQNAKR